MSMFSFILLIISNLVAGEGVAPPTFGLIFVTEISVRIRLVGIVYPDESQFITLY